jgi:hypothetical protein
MTLIQIEKRVKALETKVRRLARNTRSIDRRWYRTHAGCFANDPDFKEITDLDRAYGKAQVTRPAPKQP